MFHSASQIQNMDNLVPMGQKPIRQKPAMTTPPKSLGTKDRHLLPRAQPQKLFHPALKFPAQHVVRIIAESLGIPSLVGGSLAQTLFSISP